MSIDITGFSFSAISTFKQCPRAFKYRYLDQLVEAFSSIEAHLGSCVHETLEWAYNQRQEGFSPDLAMAREQYKTTWNNVNFENIKVVKEDKSKEDYYRQGEEFLAAFFQRVFPYDRSTTLYLEHKFQLPLGEEIVYRGVIDRIAKEADGTLRVTDYKTGRVDHPLDTLQLPSYALYIFQHNIDPQIQLCFEDLREQRTVVVPFDRSEAKKVKEELLKEIQQIRDTPLEEFITKPSILCLWCGYNRICDNPHEAVKRTLHLDSPGESRSGEDQEGNPGSELTGACPLCGGELQERSGKFGPFLGCSNFPRCRYTREIGANAGSPAQDPGVEGKDICPECGSLLKQRQGKYGAFMGCSSYPQCRFTRPIDA
jgi:RecB family exonuclease